jgi:hypothetical protein
MSDRPTSRPDHNVYTILLIIATVLVAGATVYLTVESAQLFGTWNPFAAV